MGIKLPRKKKKNLLLSVIYRFNKVCFFVSHKIKLKIFLDLEWIFDRLAHEETEKLFDPLQHPIRAYSLNFIKSKINEGSLICDIGCKYGHISYLLAQISKEVVAIDQDISSIHIAKQLYQKDNLTFIHTEAFSYLKKLNKKFDALILSHVIEHIDNPVDFLNQAKNHFRLIYIEVPDFDKTYMNHYRLKMRNDLIYSDGDHVNEFDRSEFIVLLTQCGLSVIETEYRFGVQKIWCTAALNQ